MAVRKAMRNPNGFGSVHKLPGNRRRPWRVRITQGWTEEGKQKFLNLGYYATRPDAMIALAKYNEAPWDVKIDTLTFEDLYDLWHESKGKLMEVQNLRNYNAAYKHTVPIQKMLFKDIKTLHLQKVIDNMKTKKSSKNKVKQVYSQLYKYAIQNDLAIKDYSKFVTVKDDEETKEKIPFTSEEITDIYNKDELNYDIIKLLLFTGYRINELLNLKIEDIHLEENYLMGGSKSAAGKNRYVPISKFAKPIIKKLYDADNKFLLTNKRGNNVKYQNYWAWWNKNINEHTPHDTRHTFISIMNRCGINDVSIERIVGHSSTGVTKKVYTHKNEDDLIFAMNEFDNYIDTFLSVY